MNKIMLNLLLALAFVSGSCAMERDEQDPKKIEIQKKRKARREYKAKGQRRPLNKTEKFETFDSGLTPEEMEELGLEWEDTQKD